MVSTSFFALVVAAFAVNAHVVKRADPPTDIQILNYALTLEHLENAFYAGALQKFDNATFSAAGVNRELIQQISDHEKEHVTFLAGALGSQATQPCQYSFPYTDVKTFTALSAILEGVGVSAYLGAAALIQNKAYLTAAGSILTTESRHAAWVNSAANGKEPWSGAFDVPLSLNEVYSLAAGFITSCPSENPALPVKAFPSLNVTTANYAAGGNIALAYNGSTTAAAGSTFAVFLTGVSQVVAAINNGSAVVPSSLAQSGTVYMVVTNANATVSDDNTLAGPAILMFPTNVTVGASSGGSGSGGSGSSSSNTKSGALTRAKASIAASLIVAVLGAAVVAF